MNAAILVATLAGGKETRGVKRFVNETYISAMNQNWHLGCFLCAACGKPFPGGRFVEYHDKPYDLKCFWGLQLRKHGS
uniref:LIM zinc-binding domain-containing protein n=1 Tax=Steinernema glaseri TaxID=37863 RepID=A0A1I7YS45_9BILA